jgi:hypothetical protein
MSTIINGTSNAITFPDSTVQNTAALTTGGSIASGTITALSTSGITFPSTAVPSADANTLDDYEEGSFTPTVTGSTPPTGVTYANQIGRYIKVGRAVNIEISIEMTSAGSGGSGIALVGGLPFSATNITNAYPNFGLGIAPLTSAVLGQITGQVNFNDNKITLVRNTNSTTGFDAVPYANIANNTQVRIAFTYFTAS